MKAVVCYGEGKIAWEEVTEPITKPGEVKIRVKACGICGSDLPRALERGAHAYPIILGHEFSGEVVETGENVTKIKKGMRVTAAPLVPCHECVQCKKGNFSLCEHYSFIGSRQQGAFAEYICVPEQNVVELPEGLEYEKGALFEPSTVSLHALYLTDFKPGGSVAVLGGGTMGVFALQWAKIMGAAKVVVFGRDKQHLELSRRLGADEVISTLDEDFMEKAMTLTGGQGYDYVFEAAGSVITMKYAFALAAKKAWVCFIGTPTRELSFTVKEWEQLNRKEMKLTGSWMSYSAPFPGKEWEETARHFRDGRLKFDPEIFGAVYPMEKAEEAFSLYQGGTRKVRGRVLLTLE